MNSAGKPNQWKVLWPPGSRQFPAASRGSSRAHVFTVKIILAFKTFGAKRKIQRLVLAPSASQVGVTHHSIHAALVGDVTAKFRLG